MPWNPDLYQAFKSERFAPFEDLLGLIKKRPRLQVIDLGCGTGELTQKLADALPQSTVIGIDTSEEMLERAHKLERPGLLFEKRAIEDVSGRWDLIFSHAAIQWVDDHPSLIGRLVSMLKPGGQLAVQLPSNHDHPTHTLIRQIAGEEPFREMLGGWLRESSVLGIGEYAELLHKNGCGEITIFEKVYSHELSGTGDLVTWTTSTALVPYLERLGKNASEEFLKEYNNRLDEIWPAGPVFYAFQRILFAATRLP